jgi:hypothetical protein
MNPLDHIDGNWFWGAFLAGMLGWVGYLVATDPGPRPTDYAGHFDPAPEAPGEPVVGVAFDTMTLKDAERLDGRPVVTTFTVGGPPYTWGAGASLRTVVEPVAKEGLARLVILRGDRRHDVDRGTRLTVAGTLRVARVPAATHGGKTFAASVDVRIEESRAALRAMLPALVLAAQFGPRAETLDLDALPLADARPFDGKEVVALVTAAAPPHTWRVDGKLVTIIGPGREGAEWSVFLKGNRLDDVNQGDRLKVRGAAGRRAPGCAGQRDDGSGLDRGAGGRGVSERALGCRLALGGESVVSR